MFDSSSVQPVLRVTVIGLPKPKGSGMRMPNGGYRPGRDAAQSGAIEAWASAVSTQTAKAIEQGWKAISGPVAIEITFMFARPKGDQHRTRHAVKPDLDKLERATWDALRVAGAFVDDALIWSSSSRKVYSDGRTGATIRVWDDSANEAADREQSKARAGKAKRAAGQPSLLGAGS